MRKNITRCAGIVLILVGVMKISDLHRQAQLKPKLLPEQRSLNTTFASRSAAAGNDNVQVGRSSRQTIVANIWKWANATRQHAAGLALLKEGEYQQAARSLTRSIELLATPDALVTRAECWWQLGRADRFTSDVESAFELDPDVTSRVMVYIERCMEEGNYDLAIGYYRILFRLDPVNCNAYEQRCDCHERTVRLRRVQWANLIGGWEAYRKSVEEIEQDLKRARRDAVSQNELNDIDNAAIVAEGLGWILPSDAVQTDPPRK